MTDQPQEPYTRVPNALLDNMHELGNAELRVLLAVIRKTAGFQKSCDVISVSQVADMTGLTRRNAHEALQALVTAGYLDREQASKQMYCYTVKPYPVGIRLDHTPTGNVPPRDTAPYPVGIQSEVKPYPLGDTQKKDSKEKKERVTRASDDAASRPTRKARGAKPDVTPEPIRNSIAAACAAESGRMLARVNKAAKAIWSRQQANGKTVEQTVAAVPLVAAFLRRAVYPFTEGQPLTPEAFDDRWAQAAEDERARRKQLTDLAAPPPVASDAPRRMTREESAARLRELAAAKNGGAA